MATENEYWVVVDHSVIIDKQGHCVDGHSRVTLKETDEVNLAINKGQLMLLPTTADDTEEPSGVEEPSGEKMSTTKKASTKSVTEKEK